VLTDRVLTWSSTNDLVASVSANGLVSGRAPGTATIRAQSEGVTGSVSVSVTWSAAPVATLIVSLGKTSLYPSETTNATVALFDAQGLPLTGRAVQWSSSAIQTATVSFTATVTAISPGTAEIRATSEGRVGGATLTVLAPPPFQPGPQQPTAGASMLAIYPPGVGQVVAQTFTSPVNQWLGYVQLPVGCQPNVILHVTIKDGLTGPTLYDARVVNLGLYNGTWRLIQLYNPAVSMTGVRILAGRTYAMVLTAEYGPSSAYPAVCGIATSPPGNLYPGGEGFYQDPINGPNFLPISGDLPFIALVRVWP
jgi:hypothetical protein